MELAARSKNYATIKTEHFSMLIAKDGEGWNVYEVWEKDWQGKKKRLYSNDPREEPKNYLHPFTQKLLGL